MALLLLSIRFVLEEKVDPTPWPPFPAGIKGLSDICDPGNTFTRPKWGHHSNWHSNLPLQALAGSLLCTCSLVRGVCSLFPVIVWKAFVVTLGGITQVCWCWHKVEALYGYASCSGEVNWQTNVSLIFLLHIWLPMGHSRKHVTKIICHSFFLKKKKGPWEHFKTESVV